MNEGVNNFLKVEIGGLVRDNRENPIVLLKVTESEEDGRIVLRLEVAPDDKGKVIGRQGRVAQSMRALLRVAAVKQGTRAVLEIV